MVRKGTSSLESSTERRASFCLGRNTTYDVIATTAPGVVSLYYSRSQRLARAAAPGILGSQRLARAAAPGIFSLKVRPTPLLLRNRILATLPVLHRVHVVFFSMECKHGSWNRIGRQMLQHCVTHGPVVRRTLALSAVPSKHFQRTTSSASCDTTASRDVTTLRDVTTPRE